jgi:hypothetical protein
VILLDLLLLSLRGSCLVIVVVVLLLTRIFIDGYRLGGRRDEVFRVDFHAIVIDELRVKINGKVDMRYRLKPSSSERSRGHGWELSMITRAL